MPTTLEELKTKAEELGVEVEDNMSEEDLETLISEKEAEEKKEPTVEDLLKEVDYLKGESKKAYTSRDRAKKESKALKEKLDDAEDQLIDAPSKDDLKKVSDELKTFKELETEREKEKEEDDEKKMSDIEREKRRFDKELEKLKTSYDEKFDEVLVSVKAKDSELEKRDRQINTLTNKTLEGEIARIAAESNALKPFQVVRLLKDDFTYNDTLGEFIYEKLDNKGKIMDDMTVKERVDEYLQDPENENLLKAKGSTGGVEIRQSIETKTSGSTKGKRHGYDPKDPAIIKEADEKGLDVDFLIDTKVMQDKKLKRGEFKNNTEQ